MWRTILFVALTIGFAFSAHAEQPSQADSKGCMTVTIQNGRTITLRGFYPGETVYEDLSFQAAQCPLETGKMENRAMSFCRNEAVKQGKGVEFDITLARLRREGKNPQCRHINCDHPGWKEPAQSRPVPQPPVQRTKPTGPQWKAEGPPHVGGPLSLYEDVFTKYLTSPKNRL